MDNDNSLKSLVPTAVARTQYHLNLEATDQFCAEIASDSNVKAEAPHNGNRKTRIQKTRKGNRYAEFFCGNLSCYCCGVGVAAAVGVGVGVSCGPGISIGFLCCGSWVVG